MLDHGSQGNGEDGDDGTPEKAPVRIGKYRQTGILPEERHTYPCSFSDGLEINSTRNASEKIGNKHTHQDRDNLEDSLTPDIEQNHRADSHQSDAPALSTLSGAIVKSRTGKCKTDSNNDRASDNRREETHDALCTKSLDKGSQDEIKHTGTEHTDTGVCKGDRFSHSLSDTHSLDNGITTQESERRTKECGNLTFCDKMEKQRTKTGEKQGC